MAAAGIGVDALAQCTTTYHGEMFLPNCEHPGSGVWAIAENGDLAGGYSCGFGLGKALAIFDDVFTTLPLPSGITEGRGEDINSFQEVAGNSTDDAPEKAFRYKDGASTQLMPLSGTNRASVGGIQAAKNSKVVGYSGGSGGLPLKAVYWQDGQLPTVLNLPIGRNDNSVAFDVNDAGAIVGWMGNFPGWLFWSYGFIWENGKATDLGIPEGGIASVATCINNKNVVAGYHWVGAPGSNPTIRGWVWSNGKYTQIDPLPGYRRCLPKDINDNGVVVGLCDDKITPSDPSVAKPAFIWEDGVMMTLEGLIELPPNVEIIDAMSINNAGQIGANGKLTIPGSGVSGVALRLNPIPPIPGDVNCDRFVDVDDLLAVINNWGQKPAAGDFNQDGIVDTLDLAIVLENWTF